MRLRIAGAAAVGLLAAASGVGRLALLGWLLALIFRGEPLDALTVPFAWVAGAMLLRGFFDYWRNMVAHRTAAVVQLHLRERLYDKVVELGPGHFALERTGGVILSVIDGVEQLETYFGQYLPHVFVSLLTPLGIFAFVAYLDLPVAAVLLSFSLVTLLAPLLIKRLDRVGARRRQVAYRNFAAEFLDSIQGLATLKAFGQSTARVRLLADRAHELFRSTMWVLATNQLQRGITDVGIALGAAAALALGAWRVDAGTMSLEALLIILMMGIETFRPLRELRELLHAGMNGQSAAQAIFQLFDTQPMIRDSVAVKAAERLAPTVEFDDVEFAYPGGRRGAHSGLRFA
ncbi:MAG TPA: ABC transporter transmembrane domain-containing protein, partial [Rhodospirillales bacterium]|nr:ABC transporter transmembrane domain-containing protein [Rhodospirillales bacterium]